MRTNRVQFSAYDVACIIAQKLGVPIEDLSYMWQVAEDGAFEGVIILSD